MTNRVIKQKFYRQEFDPTDKFFYRNDLEEYERFFKSTSSLIPRRGYEPGNETNITVSYRGYSVTYLNCIEELNWRAYMSGPGEPVRLLQPWPDQYLLGFYSHVYHTFCASALGDAICRKLKP